MEELIRTMVKEGVSNKNEHVINTGTNLIVNLLSQMNPRIEDTHIEVEVCQVNNRYKNLFRNLFLSQTSIIDESNLHKLLREIGILE